MNPNRRRTSEFGVMLLLYQVFGVVGIDRIPPVTLTLVGLQVAIFLRLFRLPWHGLTDVCISFYKVFYKRQYSRLLFSAFVHANDMHLYYNMISFIVKGQSLERRFGSPKFLYLTSVFTILTNMMYLILARLAGEIDESFETQCAVGFSGVLFALKTLTTYYDPNYSHYVMGIPILLPAKYAVWAELILIQVLMPNVSLLGHMGGVLVGLAYTMGPLKLVMDFVYNVILALLNPGTLLSRPQHRFTSRAEPSGHHPGSQFSSYVPSGMSEEEQLRQATEASLQDNFAHQHQAPYPAPRQQPSSEGLFTARPPGLYPANQLRAPYPPAPSQQPSSGLFTARTSDLNRANQHQALYPANQHQAPYSPVPNQQQPSSEGLFTAPPPGLYPDLQDIRKRRLQRFES